MRPPPTLALLLGCALLTLGCSSEDAAGPNLLLISVDTLRPDHLGLYGYARDTTPRLDAFFGEGTVFDTVWASAPCTLPSVPQFLMGSYELTRERPLLAEILRDHGYATAAVVSQHQFDPSHHKRPSQKARAELVWRGFEHFDIQERDEIASRMTTRTADSVTRAGLDWLEDNAGRRPFFVWLHYFDPHDPYQPPEAFRGFDAESTSRRSGDIRRQLKRGRLTPDERWAFSGYVFDEADVDHFVNLYDGEIRFTDAQIGRVLDALRSAGLVDDTIVVLVADHGEVLGEGERWTHCLSLAEPEVRVPLMIRDRGRPIAGARRVATPASTLDLVPTVLGLLEIPEPASGLDGVDLRAASRRPLFASWRGASAVLSGAWKLVHSGGLDLYDLSSEEGEERDLLASQPERGQRLAEEIARFRRANPGLVDQNAEILGQLQELGYIE